MAFQLAQRVYAEPEIETGELKEKKRTVAIQGGQDKTGRYALGVLLTYIGSNVVLYHLYSYVRQPVPQVVQPTGRGHRQAGRIGRRRSAAVLRRGRDDDLSGGGTQSNKQASHAISPFETRWLS